MHVLRIMVMGAILAMPQHASMPAGMSHEEHAKGMAHGDDVARRGAVAMGFDQERTAHHFRLTPDGGSIEVQVTDSADANLLEAVRTHLRSIAAEFSRGNFEKPFQTHGETPPGVVEMQKDRASISYRYAELPLGGTVLIRTASPQAVRAVHAFLRYQITEHHTGDSLHVQRDRRVRR